MSFTFISWLIFLLNLTLLRTVTGWQDGDGLELEEETKLRNTWRSVTGLGSGCEAPNPEWSFHLSDDIILRYFLYKGVRNKKEKEISPFEMFETVDPN